MKKSILALCLLLAFPLFSQKKVLDIEYDEIAKTSSLGEYGTVFYEVTSRGSTQTQINYLSADGKVSWKSKKIGAHSYFGGYLPDKTGITYYGAHYIGRQSNKIHAYIRFDYAGNTIEKGKHKYQDKAVACIRFGEKTWFLLEYEPNFSGATKMYLQAIDPINLKPLGEPIKIGLPDRESKQDLKYRYETIKGTVTSYWSLAGHDDKYLLFYGKRTDTEKGEVVYEFVKADFSGRQIGTFEVEILLKDGKFIHRTECMRNINEKWENYTTDPGTIGGINIAGKIIDQGIFGGCHVDWPRNAIYFYGCYGKEPDDGKTKTEGYFIQKFTLSGENIWRYQTKDDVVNQKASDVYWRPMYLMPHTASGRVYFSNFPSHMLSVDSMGANPELIAVPAYNRKNENRMLHDRQMDTRWSPDLYSMYHSEAMIPDMLTNIFGTAAGTALQTHLEKNGHPLSAYVIQKIAGSFRVLEFDPEGKQNVLWDVPFKN